MTMGTAKQVLEDYQLTNLVAALRYREGRNSDSLAGQAADALVKLRGEKEVLMSMLQPNNFTQEGEAR